MKRVLAAVDRTQAAISVDLAVRLIHRGVLIFLS